MTWRRFELLYALGLSIGIFFWLREHVHWSVAFMAASNYAGYQHLRITRE